MNSNGPPALGCAPLQVEPRLAGFRLFLPSVDGDIRRPSCWHGDAERRASVALLELKNSPFSGSPDRRAPQSRRPIRWAFSLPVLATQRCGCASVVLHSFRVTSDRATFSRTHHSGVLVHGAGVCSLAHCGVLGRLYGASATFASTGALAISVSARSPRSPHLGASRRGST